MVRDRRHELIRRAVRAILVGLAYYIAARLSLRLALVGRNVTPLWPPTGIALASFILIGWSTWPGVAIAALLVNLPISTHAYGAVMTAAGNTLAPAAAAWLLLAVGFETGLARIRDAVAIVILPATAMLISATIGVTALLATQAIVARQFGSAWAVWWAGDAMGALVVAPFLFSLSRVFRRGPTTWSRRFEAAGLFAVLVILTALVARSRVPLLFLVLPVLAWVAWRFPLRGSPPAALLVVGVAAWATAHRWGGFAAHSLFDRMLTLQAFNATAALTCFFVAALVTERRQAAAELERSAAELEVRVQDRTAELGATVGRLRTEMAERREAERHLRDSERQLAEAQQVAKLGSWEWLIREGRITWSDEMFRVYGYEPRSFDVTFERAMERVVEEDRGRIQSNLQNDLARTSGGDLPSVEYRIRLEDGTERTLVGRSRMRLGKDDKPLRLVGTVRDVTEERRAEREHRIAATLQRSFLPEHLPVVPGVALASRYVSAADDMTIGGDWYDTLPLPDGHLGIAIGDVAGHGLQAASTMGQIRMALRSYALSGGAPSEVIGRLRVLMAALLPDEMATLVYAVLDPESSRLTFANAGHPPPLLLDPSGRTTYLSEPLGPPLVGSARAAVHDLDGQIDLPTRSTLLLYTDGLVERRGEALTVGLARLQHWTEDLGADVEGLCDGLLAQLLTEERTTDDVALLAVRAASYVGSPFRARLPAEARSLAPLRAAMRRWLRENVADREADYPVLLACGEASANAIQHAYGTRGGSFEVGLRLVEGAIEATVRDHGTWREGVRPVGGRGLTLMRTYMDDVSVDARPSGTMIRMRRRIDRPAAS